MTIIGLPLAVLILALYLIFLYLAKIGASIAIGQFIVNYGFKKSKKISLFLILVLGLLVYYLFTSLPYIGSLLAFLATLWTIGCLAQNRSNLIKTT